MDVKIPFRNKVKLFKGACSILWGVSHVYFLTILFLSAFSGVFSPLNAIVWRHALDEISKMIEANMWGNSILFMLTLYSGLNLLTCAFRELLRYLKQTYSDMVNIHITKHVLQKSSEFSMQTYDNPEIYNHLNMAISESGGNCLSLLDAMSDMIISMIQFCSFIIIVVQLNWIIAPVCIMSALPLLFISLKMNAYWYSIFFQRAETNRLIDYLKMTLVKNENIKEVKLYKISSRIISFILKSFNGFLISDKAVRKKFIAKKGAAEVIDELVSLVVKVVIVFLCISNGNTIGLVSLYFSAQDNLKTSIIVILSQITILENCLLYLQSLDTIEQVEKETKEDSKNLLPFSSDFKLIEFRNVSFCYPGSDRYVLKNISITFENGKTYSIVGFNGSGKTTLIKLLLRLYQPTEGQILVDGTDINSFDISTYYAQIGAVFQDFLRLPYSLFDNVTLRDSDPSQSLFYAAVETAGISQLIEDLPEKEQTLMMKDWTGGVDVSQGQWQKMAIARGCYGNRDILILDEPFSSIDAQAETQIIDKLSKARENRLTVYITHRFSSISLADQIIVLKYGEIVESGTHKELMETQGLYQELYNAQLKKLIKHEEIKFEEPEADEGITTQAEYGCSIYDKCIIRSSG